MSDDHEGDPTTWVADADVLAADLLVGGDARRVLDQFRSHSWLTLVASDLLLDDAEAVVADLADAGLASDWRETVSAQCTLVEHPASDHPALASAYHGGAGHVITFDETLTSVGFGANVRAYMDLSARTPEAFAALFDAERLYEATFEAAYPGPDGDPRA